MLVIIIIIIIIIHCCGTLKKPNDFHHTGSLEVFHSLLLKHCPKWQHFSYDGMQAHIELAILDHNYNIIQLHIRVATSHSKHNNVLISAKKQTLII